MKLEYPYTYVHGIGIIIYIKWQPVNALQPIIVQEYKKHVKPYLNFYVMSKFPLGQARSLK